MSPLRHIGAYRDAGLLGCIALALLLHGLLLAPIWHRPIHTGISGKAAIKSARPMPMQVSTLIEAPQPASVVQPAPLATAAPTAPEPKVLRRKSAEAEAKSEDDGSHQAPDVWPSVQEGQVLINYPDAPLPGGWLRMRVLVELDAAGRIETLESDMPPIVPAAFFEAVRVGMANSTISPGYLKQRAVASSVCLEVVFDERSPGVKASLLDGSLGNRKRCLGAAPGQASSTITALQPGP